MKRSPETTIILPNGKIDRWERRSHGAYRPYNETDGAPQDQEPSKQQDRRQRRRRRDRPGRIVDLEG